MIVRRESAIIPSFPNDLDLGRLTPPKGRKGGNDETSISPASCRLFRTLDCTVLHIRAAGCNQPARLSSKRTDVSDLDGRHIGFREEYYVYQHTSPITSANLDEANRVAELPEGTSIFWTERARAEEYPPEANGGYNSLQNYVIQPLGAQLSDTTGLFVRTASENRNSYYAVTASSGGVENRSGIGPGNSIGPVAETVADPEPVLVWQSSGSLGRVYTQFMDYSEWNPTFETPNGPTYAYNYFVGLPRPDQCGGSVPSSVALILHLEGYGTRYEAEDGSHYYCAVEVWGDDPRQSWYYGYSATHDYSDTEASVTTGPIVNYTEERLLRSVYDVLRDPVYSAIDTQRIYAYGQSMGGSGALSLGLRYPDVFAAVYCGEPMTNYRGALLWHENDLIPRWGDLALNLPVVNRGHYASHLAAYNGTGVYDWMNHHQQMVERRGEKTTLISLAHGSTDDTIVWADQGLPAYEPFYLSRRPFSAAVLEDGHSWFGFVGLGPTLAEGGDAIYAPFFGLSVVRDETVPALTYASGSLPAPPDGAGGYNLNLEWSASWNLWDGPPIDTPTEWRISLRTTDGSSQTVDVTPRRWQSFVVAPGATYLWENRRVSDDGLVDSGAVVADSDGLVTVTAFAVNADGNRLLLRSSGDLPTPTPTSTGNTPTNTRTSTPVSTPTPTEGSVDTPTPTNTATSATPSVTPGGELDLDLDNDGDVDASDLLILLEYLRTGDLRGDVNGDGETNAWDLFPYPERWLSGGSEATSTPTNTLTFVPATSTPTSSPTLTSTAMATATPTTGGATDTFRVPLEVTFPAGWSGPAPVTVGVPLPPGDIEPEDLTVVDDAGPVPSQVKASVRENVTGPVMWLLVDFQAVPGVNYALERGTPPSPADTVTVTARVGGGVDVDTGAGSYEVLPSTNLFGAIRNSAGEPPLATGGTWGGGATVASVEVVDDGPLRAMVRLRAQSAVEGLDLVARMHFYAGIPFARVRITLANRTTPIYGSEAPAGSQNGDCGISEGQPPHQALGSPGSISFDDITWGLSLSDPPASEDILYQDSSGTGNWDYYVGQGPRMQSGVTRRGYYRTVGGTETDSGNFADGTLMAGGIRLDVPWFRELFPKALRARAGRIEFGLFPGEYSIDHQLRAGEQKTHDLWIGLEPASPPPIGLRAVPAFDWIRSTHGLGYVGQRVAGEHTAYETYLDDQFDETGPTRDGLALSVNDAQESADLFGWTDFGDLPTDYEDERSPLNLKYDVSLGFVHQALRIGTTEWWRWAEISNLHFADIDLFHTRKRGYSVYREWIEGGAWGHSLHDETGLTNPHRNCNNPHPDLTYGMTGMAAWALLTGDDMVREAAVEMADNILWRLKNTQDSACAIQAWGGGNGEGYAVGDPPLRGMGNSVRILVWAWRLTGDRAYLNGAGAAAEWYVCEQAGLTCGSWPHALFTRALGEYILAAREAGIPEDPNAVPAMDHALNEMGTYMTFDGDRGWFQGCTNPPDGEINAWMLLGADAFAFGYAVTGDHQWLDDYATPAFNTGSEDPFYAGDISEYHSSKELVNTVAAGTIFLHFIQEASVAP